MKRPSPLWRWAVLLSAALFAIISPAEFLPGRVAAFAQTVSPIEYQRYDVELVLQDNGDLQVQVRQRVTFDGEYERAFLEIPLDFTAGIGDVSVSLLDGDSESPADFHATPSGDAVFIAWTYPRTEPGDTREFIIDYRVAGALWVYGERDILRWDAIHADRSGIPVHSGQVTVILPAYVPLDAVHASALGVSHSIQELDNTLIFALEDTLPDGLPFNIQVDFPHGLVNASVQEWQKDEDTAQLAIDMPRMDVDVWIKQNGTLVVREEMAISIESGVLYEMYREIRRLYLDEITHLRVTYEDRLIPELEPPCDACLVITSAPREDGWVRYDSREKQIEIDESRTGYVRGDWSFAPVYSGQTTSFAVEFAVRGAVRQLEDGQSFVWQVIPDFGIQPALASVRIHPPEGLSASELVVTGVPDGISIGVDPQGWLSLKSPSPLPPGELWDLNISMPAGAVDRAVPQWQTELESALADQTAADVAAARRRLAVIVGAVLFSVLLLMAAIIAWFKWGRKHVREMLGGYASEPPSGLSPGIVAYLVDGSVRPNSLLASLLHLGVLGLIQIDLRSNLAFRLVHTSEVSETELRGMARLPQSDPSSHLVYLFNRVILPAAAYGGWVSLPDLHSPLQRSLAEFYAAMAYDAQTYLLRRGTGRASRQMSPALLMLAWLSSAAAIIYVTFRFEIPGGLSIALVGMAFLVFFVLHVRRELGATERYSDRGAAERAAWLRFRNYLANLRRYGEHGAARRVLEKYFAYAVALGVEDLVLAQAAVPGARPPTWLVTLQQSHQHQNGSASQPAQPHTAASPHPPQPTPKKRPPLVRNVRPAAQLAAVSRAAGASLSNASTSLGALLSTAAGIDLDGPIQVTLKSATGTQSLSWDNGTSLESILDDILGRSMADTRHAAQMAERSSSSSRRSSAAQRGIARSSGGFGSNRSAFRSSRGTRSTNTSRSSSRRTGGAGRSGFS